MATQEEILKLTIQLEREEEVAKLEAQISLIKQKMIELGSAYKGTPGWDADIEKLADLKSSLDSIQNAAKTAADAQKQAAKDAASAAKDAADKQKQAVKDVADAAKKAAKDARDASRETARQQAADARQAARAQQQAADDAVSAERRKSRRLLEISRATEDAQYGLAGVLNNIPSVLESFSVPTQFIGGIQIAVVLAAQLYKHWDDLAGLWGQGKTESEASAMEKLAKATEKSADEAERLARYQAVNKKAEELGERDLTPEQEKTEKLVTEALKKAGPREVVQQMLKGNEKQFDAALPGLADDKGNLLKDPDGSVRTALTERDYYAKRKKELDAKAANGEFIAPGHQLLIDRKAVESQQALDAARQNAGMRQLATNAVPDFYPDNLKKTIERMEKDPTFLGHMDWKKRRDLLKDLKQATPEAQEELQEQAAEEHSTRIKAENDHKLEEFQREAAKKGQEENDKKHKQALAEARKKKTFVGKEDKDLTPVEKESKKEHDEFENKVNASLRSMDFLGEDLNVRNNEDLTPEQQEASRRYTVQVQRRKQQEQQASTASNEAKQHINEKLEDDPEGDAKLEFEFLQRLGSGRNASQVKATMTARLKEQYMRMDGDLSEEDATEMAQKNVNQAGKGVFENLTKDRGIQNKVETHQGTAAFLEAIQGGFSRNNPNKGVEDKLDKLYDLIAQDQGGQQVMIGMFGP